MTESCRPPGAFALPLPHSRTPVPGDEVFVPFIREGLRWAAVGMMEAAKQFRRVKGFSQLPQLAAAIKEATSKTEDCLETVTPAA